MHAEPKKIIVNPNSEVARLLDEAAERPLLLEKDGVRYRLNKEEEDIWAGYDPEAVRQAIRTMTGRLAVHEAEQLKAFIYRAREEGTRPLDRP
jgi:hypothetical protein